jgi:hypothetical protein
VQLSICAVDYVVVVCSQQLSVAETRADATVRVLEIQGDQIGA